MKLRAMCKPCLNKKYPLRKQLLLSFLTLAAVSLLLALAVVMGTTAYIGDKAESEARDSLEEQITRHLADASVEAAAFIGERFRKLQYGVLDVTAFALRDAMQEDLTLDNGTLGYPLSPAHTDLRDTEITASAENNLTDFSDRGQSFEVDLTRSVWYYADSNDFTVEVADAEEVDIISRTARLDLLWPSVYINSNDTKAILIGADLSFRQTLRYFPGAHLSGIEGSFFACQNDDGSAATCYNPLVRPWYTKAIDDDLEDPDPDTNLGPTVITDPYLGAIDNDWLVTLSRAVYGDTGSLLGVAGVDVRLQQVQTSIEGIGFLDSGYSILATKDTGTVLAAPDRIWDRDVADKETTVCELGIGICTGDWEALVAEVIAATAGGGGMTFTSVSATGAKEEAILVAAPVTATFDDTDAGGDGTVTHYILSAVPKVEIFEPVSGMADLIQDSTSQIIITTAIVALCTLAAVAGAVYFLSGSITRPIVKMTAAARSVAKDGAKTNVFGSAAAAWGDDRSADRATALDYLLCRGDDEISTLAREFSLMITGLGRRGEAAQARGLGESTVFPQNPLTTEFVRPPPVVPAATAPVSTP